MPLDDREQTREQDLVGEQRRCRDEREREAQLGRRRGSPPIPQTALDRLS